MGLQLIFVVETNKRVNSDWIYIKDTIERFYEYSRTQLKLTPVYMDGRGKYKKKEKEIKGLISQYRSTSKANETKVIYCFDCDDYNKNAEDHRFLKEVQQYCKEMNYDYVWFCRDVEEVYLGERIPDHLKKEKAALFKSKKQIQHIDKRRLEAEDYNVGRSNLMKVLDLYLTQK